MSPEVARVCDAVRAKIDLTNLSLPDEYFYASLPLCVIDAVFSIGVTYSSTQGAVARWCERQDPPWTRVGRQGRGEHTISELIESLKAVGPDKAAEELFGNRQRTSSKSGILKAEAVLRFGEVLKLHGVQGFGDTEDPRRNANIDRDLRAVPGQGSGISWEYFLMLAGSDDYVKADRMVCRFVAEALGVEAVTPQVARSALIGAASDLGLAPRALDYAVWTFQRAQ
jgi:hypothetical protein